ncbi:uncharacterized protein [Henckelia pumila]|uniref:uncharacterized protein n=1 Tax=Henckelia pumila TaxID=405737 RepID=UPI003C6E0F89
MVRPMPIYTQDNIINPIPLAIGLFVSISILVSLCAKHHHAKKVPRKCAPKGSSNSDAEEVTHKIIGTPSHKTIPLPKKAGDGSPESDAGDKGLHEEGFVEVGLWQKAILMGDKCRPPQFSGVIYYDYSGNRIPEMPRSPKASSLMNYVAEKNGDSM